MKNPKTIALYNRLFDLFDQEDEAGVKALLAEHPNLATSPFPGWQPIHHAARSNWGAVVELLVQLGADVNCRDEDGKTPLHLASESCINAARVLIQLGADPNVVDNAGFSPVVWGIFAQSAEGAEIAQMLLDAGAEYDLSAAAAKGDLARAQTIIESDPDAVANTPCQETLLSVWLIRKVLQHNSERKCLA